MILSASSRTSQDFCPYWKTTPPSHSKDLWRSRIRMIAEGRGEFAGPFFAPARSIPSFYHSLGWHAPFYRSVERQCGRAGLSGEFRLPVSHRLFVRGLEGERASRVRIPDIRAGQDVRGYALLLPACNWFAGKTRRNPIVRACAKFGPPTPAGFLFRFQ